MAEPTRDLPKRFFYPAKRLDGTEIGEPGDALG
jgi:hypothetical protein